MRINLYEKTPASEIKPVLKVILIFLGVSAYGMPLLLAYCIFTETDKVLAGILSLVLPPLLAAVFIVPTFKMARSYAEYDEENVRIVDCYTFSEKEKIIPRTEIVSRENGVCAQYSPGRRYIFLRESRVFINLKYIVFKNSEGEYLFKILETPEGIKWADELMNK